VNVEDALAICFSNLKGYKDKDLFATAQALSYLKTLPENRSNKKVGKLVGVSGEIVREFISLLRLPEAIQDLFKQGQLKHLEQVRRLWQLARINPGLLDETAVAISQISAWDGRLVIDYILKNPGVVVSDALKVVNDSKTITEKEYHVIAILSEEEYKLLAAEAKKHKTPVDLLVTSIVQQWLESRGYHG